ncbi:undecaprenyldiphospho-muramoylpentapeptide beta-N-acetylglucosaminyltransferase [Oceanicoccus sp. KOV_DT_Chl]|uniref:undecaprenyldiphospho-muramoylpentapeptide beta-N-acetylglucosaminyltransferase n=1 Tax=Oceanicoccus sp. KOV_DT_Chl TaxID=1904639 RepID=UPI00190EDEC4|nr:undecaprenyldiphospho-muramoylpentapeptide beta-N-acetylglucosaminyltransferase [Oceanicoccus sp. KOV_DT_Chl]
MNKSIAPSVLIMAGGTGGHVFPALAAAECLQAKGIHVEWLGTRRGIESLLVPAANIPIHFITVSGLRGKGVLSVIKGLLQVVSALWQSVKVLAQLKPVCVLGMGGFASGPGGLAAVLTGRPLVIHEQNSVAGTTNKLLAKIASKVLLAYPKALVSSKALHVGNPVRKEIAQLPAPEQRGIGSAEKIRLLVLGGSLGAKPINDLLPAALALIDGSSQPEVWHQTGKSHIDEVRAAYQQVGITVKAEAFISDMAAAYQWADVVLCRAGALTVAELTAAGVGSLLVPLPHAIDDHQTGNAQWLVENDAGKMLPQAQLDAPTLSGVLQDLSSNRAPLLAMAIAARALAKTDAAEQVANTCLEVANG